MVPPSTGQGQPGVAGAARQGFGWALGCLILAIVVIVGVLGLLWVGLTAATPSEESPGDTAAAPSSDDALLSATLQGTGGHTGPPFTLSGGDSVLTWSATSTGDASSAWPFAAFVEDANGVADSSSVDTDYDRPMDDSRSSDDSLAVATVVALVVWAAFDAAAMGPSQISAIQTEPGPVDWTALARFILGATVILAVAYTLKIRAIRLDLVALVIWTLGFAYVAFDRSHVSEYICPPGVRGFHLSCTLPWAPGTERMALWFLVSAAILTVGYVFRRLRSAQRKPSAA